MSIAPLTDLTTLAISRQIKAKAMEIGFDLVGIASAEPSQYREHFRRWIDGGNAGSMNWMTRRFEERTEPAKYLPGAKSVVCVALNYHAPLEPVGEVERRSHGRIARYALGDDYHDLMKGRLHHLADWLGSICPGVQTKCGVDTAPIMERELAARAGIGWMGKNTCIIHPRIGSWILLGEMLSTLPLPADEPIGDHCGSCRRCIDACPTGAITAPYEIDARRCISYLTIEHREEIARSFHAPMGDWLYGCDVCQEVCPHNQQAPSAIHQSLKPRFPDGGLDVEDVRTWTDEEYRVTLRHSAMKRTKLPVLKRNAAIVQNNRLGDKSDESKIAGCNG